MPHASWNNYSHFSYTTLVQYIRLGILINDRLCCRSSVPWRPKPGRAAARPTARVFSRNHTSHQHCITLNRAEWLFKSSSFSRRRHTSPNES
ncbi:hypothetical protein BDV96DRAFT_113092 [Lophiotrema nucula]|uniref:Uncharacterized protein n=1 Tax=Lophiotrema nucula TaxID=690887 RepID=A0A6A5Z356_9PLEO|nr:hypothetical protein BDV96DRAFT_113092 [Lophiotrema nucula]